MNSAVLFSLWSGYSSAYSLRELFHLIPGPSLREGHCVAGPCSEKSNEAGDGTRKQDTEEIRLFSLEKRKLRGDFVTITAFKEVPVRRALLFFLR